MSTSVTNPEVIPVNIVHGTHAQLIAFLVLNMWPSLFGLPILVAVILFSKNIQRHPTLINLLIVFIIVGISSSLLVYAGKTSGPEPPKMLCLFQASMLYGVPALTSISAFTLVFQMFIVIRGSFYGQEVVDEDHALRVLIMLSAPYIGMFIFALATAFVGAAHPAAVSRDRRFFYCSVKSRPLTDSMTLLAAIFLFATFILEVWSMVILYKMLVVLRWQRQRQSSAQSSLELNMPIRIMAFGLYIILAMSLSLLSVKAAASPVPDLAIATAASVVILIFGTQPDILRVLCLWRAEPYSTSSGARSSSPEQDLKVQTESPDRGQNGPPFGSLSPDRSSRATRIVFARV